MIWYAIELFLVMNAAFALQNTDHHSVKNFSPPEEVNALEKSQIVPRSISDHVESQNTEDTIKEVETLIKSNPDLPRLTRGEILDILDNITKEDNQNLLLQTINKNSNRDPKAFMVVKAYTPLGSGEINVEEFYTKPPITSIVESDDEDPKAEQVISSTSTQAPYFRQKITISSEDKKINIERKKPYRGTTQFKTSTTLGATLRSRSTSTTNPPPTTRKEIKRRRRPPVSTTTMMAITTYRPRGRLPPKKEIKYSNHKYPEEVSTTRPSTYSSHGIKVVEPPKFAPTQINYELEDLLPQEVENQEVFIPMKANPPKNVYSVDKVNSISEPSIELEIPEHLKKVVADLNLAAVNSPDAVSVTSIVSPSEKDEGDKLKDILASIGVLPPSTTTSTEMPDANVVADSLSPDMQELLKSFGLLPDSSTEIQHQSQNDVSGFNPEKAEIHRDAYVGFKPLPEDNDGRKEMEALLEQFGLLDKTNRKSKSSRTGKSVVRNNLNQDIQIEKISIDAVPEDLQPVLRQMGFGERTGRKIRENPINKMVTNSDIKEKPKLTEKQHVFNPAETDYVSDEEMRKLGRLLEVMKKLEKLNGTITEEDLKDIDQKELQDLIVSLQGANKNGLKGEQFIPLNEQNAPNPIEYDFGLSKNEVKRQQGTTSTEKVETVTADTATEETKTPSLKDLEDSFGGGADTVTEALPETTTPRRTGFYYLLDWNTFLDIDDQKGKRVNLRLQPKVGDPKQFLNVKIP